MDGFQTGNCVKWFLLLSISLSGCTNLEAVRSYAGETKNLTSALTPILEGSVQSCRDRKARIKLFTGSAEYDPQAVSAYANTLCEPILEGNKHAAVLAQTLTDYADLLERISGDSVPIMLGSSEDKLNTAITNLKDSDNQPIVSEAKANAVTSLAKFVSEQSTNIYRKKEIKAALNHHEAVETIGRALITYTTSNFIGYIESEKKDLALIMESVRKREESEYLAARYIQNELWTIQNQLDAKVRSARQFEASVNKMIEAHNDLLENVDGIGKKERLKAVFAFAKEVRSLERQLNSAF